MGTAVYGGSPRHNAARRISVGNATHNTALSGSIGIGIASHLGHSSPALHQHQQLQHQHHHQSACLPQQLQHQHHQSATATMFSTVQSAAGSAALLMNHSNSTIIFPPPTSFVSAAVPVASAFATATAGSHMSSGIGSGGHHHQYQHSLPSPHYSSHSSQQQQLQYHQRHSKRKSAVEMLAESKPFYVKSETVLDRGSQQSGQSFYAANRQGNGTGNQPAPSCTMSPSRSQMSHHMRNASTTSSGGGGNATSYSTSSASRRSVSSSSDLLQTKLRSLLNNTSLDHGGGSGAASVAPSDATPDASLLLLSSSSTTTSTLAATPAVGKMHKTDMAYDQYHHMHYASPKKLSQELSVLPDQNGDLAAFFPSAFLSPQSLPPHPAVTDDDIFSYGIDEPLISDFQTISPPAEYAEDGPTMMHAKYTSAHHQHQHHSGVGGASRGYPNATRYAGYQRSFSHSPSAAGIAASSPNDDQPHHHQYHSSTTTNASHSTASTAAAASAASAAINSHKSLPDLHAQISRHSPHSEALSCCSRGARSNKSGSSFNRDSGGSSGHYTHRSEPNSSGQAVVVCGSTGKYATNVNKSHPMSQQHQHQQQQPLQPHQMLSADPMAANAPANGSAEFRRDSGSSTQHSGNSYYAYGIPPQRYDCMECRTKLPPTLTDDSHCLLNFTTPEVPEAFQDDYQQQQQKQHRQHPNQQQIATTAQMMMLMMVGGKPPSSSAAAARYSRDKDIVSNQHYNQQRQPSNVHQQQQHHRGFASGATYGEDTIDHSMIQQTQMVYYNKVHVQQHSQQQQQQPDQRGAVLETELSPPLGTFKRQRCMRVKQRDRYSSPSDRTSRCSGGGGGGGGGGNDDASSIDRRPILRSKSDVSDRHWHQRNAAQQLGGGVGGVSPTIGSKLMDGPPATARSHSSGSSAGGGSGGGSGAARSEVLTQLERFFDRLGLQEEVYDACIAPKRASLFGSACGSGGGVGSSGRSGDNSNDSDHSSPVFFSDASTVDSARIVERAAEGAAQDSAAPLLTQQQQQMYRPSEPPSIVERNARIIKWLCACRKSQLA